MLIPNIINRIKLMLARWQLDRKSKNELEKRKIDWYSRPISERLAMGTCEWVKLKWNGHQEEFLINNLNVADLAVSGRFPNVIVYFMKLAKTEEDDDPILEVDMKKVKEEEQELYEEVARKSMVNPTFQEVYDSIINIRKERKLEIKVECIKDVIPYDFLQDLFKYHLERWVEGIKKNLNTSILTASGGSQNILDKNHLHTFQT